MTYKTFGDTSMIEHQLILPIQVQLPLPDGKYQPITNKQQLTWLVEYLSDAEILSIDVETSSVDQLTCTLYGIAITKNTYEAFYIPIDVTKNLGEQISLFAPPSKYCTLIEVRQLLGPIITNNVPKVMHNMKYDITVLERHGFTIGGYLIDTMLSAWVLGNIKGAKFGLKELSERKLGYDQTHFNKITEKGKIDFKDVEIQKATDYAAADVDMTLRLWQKEDEQFNKTPQLRNVVDLDFKTCHIIRDWEVKGTRIDRPYLEAMREPILKEMSEYEELVYDGFSKRFNVGSNKQLLEILNKSFSGVTIEKTEKDDIEKLIIAFPDHIGLKALLEWRLRQKLYSTYIQGILDKLDKNNRLHTSFRQTLVTGRLSSSGPNLQNMPVAGRSKIGDKYNIRKAFIPEDGAVWFCIDYSQLEFRVVTHITGDPTWTQAYLNDKDLHQETADMLGLKGKNGRDFAKTVGFGVLYGRTKYGLAPKLGMTLDEADDFIINFLDGLPEINKYIESRKEDVLKQGYVENFYGRRLYFKRDLKDEWKINAAQREGINFPVQSGAGEVMKLAGIGVTKLLENYKSFCTVQVHDELGFTIFKDEINEVVPKLKSIMENVVQFNVPMKVDVEYGDNWSELKKWNA